MRLCHNAVTVLEGAVVVDSIQLLFCCMRLRNAPDFIGRERTQEGSLWPLEGCRAPNRADVCHAFRCAGARVRLNSMPLSLSVSDPR